MPAFGTTSMKRLNTCDFKIQSICKEAIKIIDFSIITGHRTEEEQNSLYPKYTKLKWPHGKHNAFPSRAVDVAPYIKPYGAIFGNTEQVIEIMEMHDITELETLAFVYKSYARLIGVIEGIAGMKGIPVRLGIDWDGDYDMLDQDFHDLGHIELR